MSQQQFIWKFANYPNSTSSHICCLCPFAKKIRYTKMLERYRISLFSFFLNGVSLFFKINFNFTLFYFTILYWFCHTLTWIHYGCTWVPKHEPPSHLPPLIISLDHPHAPAPSILYPASDMDWRFVSYMIVHMFQCHSPKSSHPLPLPLPQSPKVCSTFFRWTKK